MKIFPRTVQFCRRGWQFNAVLAIKDFRIMLLLSYSWVIAKTCNEFKMIEKEPHLAKHKNAYKERHVQISGCHYLHVHMYVV